MGNYNDNITFEEFINNSLKEMKEGQTVTGKIISITANGEIFVDIGYKADGIITKEEFSYDENVNPANEFKPGDRITADILKMNDGMGNILLSYKRAKLRINKKEFESKVNHKCIFTDKVAETNESGFIVNYNGIRIFIPLSLSGITREENIQDYIGKEVKFRVIEYNDKTHKIIGSIKDVIEEEKEKKLKEFWDNVKEGKSYKGTVTSISTYGAFVDVDGVQGLLHVSEMAWGRNQKPEDILKVGQEIEVKIKNADRENKRLLLIYGKKGPNPWEKAEERYHIGDVVTVKVVKLMNFGAFVQLEKGIEGLVHISQICERKIAKPEEELKVGQKVNAKIIEFDKENKRIELSIRDLEGTSNEYKEEN